MAKLYQSAITIVKTYMQEVVLVHYWQLQVQITKEKNIFNYSWSVEGQAVLHQNLGATIFMKNFPLVNVN